MTRGRPPVKNFIIETISDSNDQRLTQFREEIFTVDLGLSADMISIDKPHEWWIETLPSSISEDAFKYSNRKWDSVRFDNIEAIIDDDKIVGISGCKRYGRYLRTSMHLYLLKSVRAKYPGIKYLKHGWFDRHIQYAKNMQCAGLFFTVYPYNMKLRGLINNHRGKIISIVNKSNLLYINDIQEKGEFVFNNVPQTFFYYSITAPIEEFNPYEFI